MKKEKVDEKVEEMLHDQKLNLVTALWNNLQNDMVVPSVEELMSATKESPLSWRPHLVRCEGQSLNSCNEQKKTLQIGVKRVLLHKQGKLKNNLCLVGPPGSGKTLITQLLALFSV